MIKEVTSMAQEPQKEETLSSMQAAALLGISPKSVINLYQSGVLRGYHLPATLPGQTRQRMAYHLLKSSVEAYKELLDEHRKPRS